MKYYAACNRYSSETSVGFANTWYVETFTSRKTRDYFVKNATDRATRKITAKEVKKYSNINFNELH
jgi:hypothetical protein